MPQQSRLRRLQQGCPRPAQCLYTNTHAPNITEVSKERSRNLPVAPPMTCAHMHACAGQAPVQPSNCPPYQHHMALADTSQVGACKRTRSQQPQGLRHINKAHCVPTCHLGCVGVDEVEQRLLQCQPAHRGQHTAVCGASRAAQGQCVVQAGQHRDNAQSWTQPSAVAAPALDGSTASRKNNYRTLHFKRVPAGAHRCCCFSAARARCVTRTRMRRR